MAVTWKTDQVRIATAASSEVDEKRSKELSRPLPLWRGKLAAVATPSTIERKSLGLVLIRPLRKYNLVFILFREAVLKIAENRHNRWEAFTRLFPIVFHPGIR